MKRLLIHGILMLGLAMLCPTFHLVLGVTLVALIIVVQRLLGAFKKLARVTATEG